ncbi:hypothetical protein AGMMS49938_05660 [Fibrobacterales bacterium]|nr:hypothetical protein AGMMS49938_05660 [Fibrobacterales bacterium]
MKIERKTTAVKRSPQRARELHHDKATEGELAKHTKLMQKLNLVYDNGDGNIGGLLKLFRVHGSKTLKEKFSDLL